MTEKLQQIILDPAAVAVAGRIEVPLSGGGLEVAAHGLDFGDAEFKQFLAEGQYGSLPIDGIWPSVTVKIPLIIRAGGGVSFDDWRVKLQQKVTDINLGGGGWIKRVLPSGRYAYADLTGAKLHLGAGWASENVNLDREALLELQRLPDWYGDEIVEAAHEFTGDGAFTVVSKGTLPARVTSLTVTDKSGNNQMGLHWHFRCRNYSSAATAKWAYNAEELETLDLAEKVVTPLSPAYGTKVVKHPKLSTEWTPVLGTSIGGTTFLTHMGVYDVWARVYCAPSEGEASLVNSLPWVRLLWDVGDMVSPSENVQQQVPGKEGWYEVNLGQINLGAIPFGEPRWKGVILARGETTGEKIYVDRIRFECADEGSGVLRASMESSSLPGTLEASDSLQGSGTLAGSEAFRGGGKWEESGDEGAFTRSSEGAQRKTKSDINGRRALLSGPIVGICRIEAELEREVDNGSLIQGTYLRYVNATNWVRIVTKVVSSPVAERAMVLEYQAGGSVVSVTLGRIGSFISRTLGAAINGRGLVTVDGISNSYILPSSFWQGGANSEGKIGFFDKNGGSTEVKRTVRNFAVSLPPPSDAVIYANRNARLATAGMYRQSEDGKGYGPISYPGADLPRLPVSGPNESPVEIALKPTRGETLTVPDSGKDLFSGQLSYRPCWAEVPSS